MPVSIDLFLIAFSGMIFTGWFLGVPADIALPSSIAAALAQAK